MNNQRIAIFGATSKSAQYLVDILKRENYAVQTYSSSEKIGSEFRFNLYESQMPRLTCDFVIYFSWARNRNLEDQRIAANKALEFASLARQQNVKVIFISSLASLPDTNRSSYGLSKYVAEQGMRDDGHIIVRPGTIVSKFDPELSSAMQQLRKFRNFIWIFSRFSEKVFVPLVSIETFSSFVLDLINNDEVGEFNLFDEVKKLENLAGFNDFHLRIHLRWATILNFANKSEATDRLLTLLSVSSWIRENRR